jgi:hypothetical protein
MNAMTPNARLMPKDCDWLRQIRAACDAHHEAPGLPAEVADKLVGFGFAVADGRGAVAITDDGREALLEQDMRDAEER